MLGGIPYPRGRNSFGIPFPTSSPFMGGAYGPSSLNMPSPLNHNPFSNPRFPFLVILDFPDLSWLTNEPILHNTSWPSIPMKIPSDIPKFDGKPREDPTTHITTYHLWCVYNSMLDGRIQLHLFLCTLNCTTSNWFIELPTTSYQSYNALAMEFLIHF